MIPEDKVYNIIYNSGLYKLLLKCMIKSHGYEYLQCDLGSGCKITFEINTDNKYQLK